MREIVKISKETTWGTYAAPSTKNTDYVFTELSTSNPFTLRVKPKQKMIRTANTRNRLGKLYSTQNDVNGNLSTLLYPEQAAFFLGWATTLTSNELGSCTIDHYVMMDDLSSTVSYRRYLGVKVANLQLSGNPDDDAFTLQLQMIGKNTATITSTDFPVPAQTEFPAPRPYCFTDLASPGYLTLGTSRSDFAGFDLTVANILDNPFFESPYCGRIKFCGRDITWTDKLLFKAVTDRTTYEATTATACSAKLDNGTNSLLLDFKGANFLTAVEDDLSTDKVAYQNLSWVNSFNASAGVDFSFTAA